MSAVPLCSPALMALLGHWRLNCSCASRKKRGSTHRKGAVSAVIVTRAQKGRVCRLPPRPTARGRSGPTEVALRFRATLPSTFVRHAAGRVRHGCVHDHAADGTFNGYGFSAVRASFAGGNRASFRTAERYELAASPHHFPHSRTGGFWCCTISLVFSVGPGGEIGRRKGLKIPFSARRVWVQVPPRAPRFNSYGHTLTLMAS
jgi:hypothetical protein